MPDDAIARVRSFNRLVVQAVGALNDDYLLRQRPLGESRVLWEIGRDGRDVRELRAWLGLDSGYLSRVLRSLERAGLVTVRPSPADGRVRTAHLTRAGLAELDVVGQLSDDLARSLLDPLSEADRARLVSAMADVERLLTAALVEITDVDPATPDAQACLGAYVSELGRRFADGFDPARSISAEVDELRPPAGLFLVARLRSQAVGCGGLKLHGGEPAEVKRMWVAESTRGLGIGRRLLAELERSAAAAGARTLRLETNESLTEAIGLYRSAGYVEVERFNDEPYAHHWFEKHLDLEPPAQPAAE
jgi:DNA-binding MarR family transcriptional regulator/GNAT superfamily N-acetyltransferase